MHCCSHVKGYLKCVTLLNTTIKKQIHMSGIQYGEQIIVQTEDSKSMQD